MRPMLVVEGSQRAARPHLAAALAAAESAGWTIVRGWSAPLQGDRLLCTGSVRTMDDARRALLAAVAGAGLIVSASAGRETIDRFVDDLRRLGPVDHLLLERRERGSVTPEGRALLGLLAEGLTLADAAARLGIAQRTANRRIGAARRALGVDTTAAAIEALLAPQR